MSYSKIIFFIYNPTHPYTSRGNPFDHRRYKQEIFFLVFLTASLDL